MLPNSFAQRRDSHRSGGGGLFSLRGLRRTKARLLVVRARVRVIHARDDGQLQDIGNTPKASQIGKRPPHTVQYQDQPGCFV